MTTVTDDFNDNSVNAAFWISGALTEGGASVLETNGRLEYRVVTPDLVEGFDQAGLVLATANPAPANKNWEVRVDVSNSTIPASGQTTSVGITISNSQNIDDMVFVELYASRESALIRGFIAGMDEGGVPVPPGVDADSGNLGVTSGAVRVTYNSETKLISTYYDADGAANGYQWSFLGSYGIAGSGGSHANKNWNLSANSLLTVAIGGYSERMTIASGGAFLDNFAFSTPAPVVQPGITQHPQPLTRVVGGSAQFSVSASGTQPFSFQWRKGGVNLAEGGRISGVQTASLSIANLQEEDSGNYDVVVTNSAGSVTSNPASLLVETPAVIQIATPEKTTSQTMKVRFTTNRAGSYTLLKSNQLLGPWDEVQTINITTSQGDFTDLSTTGIQEFFRVRKN